MVDYDVIIRGGMIVDGQRNARFLSDIGIKDGYIARIGRLENATAQREIDATGLIVAPGFIDLHTHYDAQIFWDPYLSSSGWNGVTSVVIGNCGFGFAPLKKDLRQRSMKSMTKVEAIPTATMEAAMPWDWETFPEYLDSIDRADLAVNVASYLPVNPLLVWVMGWDDAKSGRKPTDAEHAEMVRLLNEAMDAGACGWSAQCLGVEGDPEATTKGGALQSDFDGSPMPTDIMYAETRLLLAKVLADRGEGSVQMSGAPLDRKHWEDLARISGAPFIWQAVVPSGGPGEEYVTDVLAWLKDCQERGLRIYGQGVTQDPPLLFTFDYWDMWDKVWNEFAGPDLTKEQKLANLADPKVRERLRQEPLKFVGVDSVEDTIIHRTYHPRFAEFQGQTVGAVAKALGVEPADAVCEMVIADDLGTIFQVNQFDISLKGIKRLIESPFIVPGLSDGGAHVKYLASGSYGTEFIARFVRDLGYSTLEEAHWRLSAFPAFCAGIGDRGTIREGAAADIIIYDYDKIDYKFPEFRTDLPGDEYRLVSGGSGYRYVLVNGQVTIEDDEQTEVYSGQLLRGGKGDPDRVARSVENELALA